MRILLTSIFLAGPAFADTCPDAPDHSARLAQLIGAAQDAPDEQSARLIANDMWALWADAPDERAQEILDRGMRRRASFDLLGALEDFDTLVTYCPTYAEGYNQRAFVRFIQQEYALALVDLEKAIALSPHHIGALSGRALSLMGLGRSDEAQEALRMALKLNPWLPERGLLREPEPPAQTDL